MGIANDLKTNARHLNGDVRVSAAELKDRALDGLDHAKTEIRETVGKVPWKPVLGAVAGICLIVGVMLVARRARNVGLLRRGLREGARLAVLIPVGTRMARKSADRLVSESAEFWDKLPKVHVEVK